MPEVPIVAVVGATAAGKTGLSLDLAERLGGEVVNTDAMQVYRGMDVGTAKLPRPSGAASPTTCSTPTTRPRPSASPSSRPRRGRWSRRCAVAASCRCWSAGRRSTPARCSTGSSSPAPTRRCGCGSRTQLAEVGVAAMHARLADVDPDAAARILPDNARRIVRALEVVRADRPVVHGDAAAARVRRPATPSRSASPSTGLVGRADRRPGPSDVRRRAGRRGGAARRSARTHRGHRDRVPGGRRPPRRGAHAGGGHRADDGGHPPVRPPAGSWFRKDPRITWVDHDDPDRVARALGAAVPTA